MTTPASRLIHLISLLQRRPNQKAGELAQELGLSVRSLHRYMHELEEMGLPIYTERGPNGGFSLVRGFKLPPLVFSPEEAVALAMGAGLVEELWGPLYRQAALSALAKLDALLPQAQREEAAWAKRSLLAMGLRRAALDPITPLLEQLRAAARDCRQVELTYQGANQSEATTRVFDPYAQANRSGWWYAVGYCHRRKAMRTFRLDRIHKLRLLDSHFEARPDFDPRAYLEAAAEAGMALRVRLRFSPEMAMAAQANPFLWEELNELADGSVEAVLKAVDVTWAASMAMSFGPGVTVVEPEEVRQEVCKWAKAMVEQYQ
jgi:predicted DNA-binding transcriptional regulator YafY